MKEGPTLLVFTPQAEMVCNGCTFLNKEAWMRGHKSVTNNFSCTHPDFEKEVSVMRGIKGKNIHFNHEGNCQTPNWCPLLKSTP